MFQSVSPLIPTGYLWPHAPESGSVWRGVLSLMLCMMTRKIWRKSAITEEVALRTMGMQMGGDGDGGKRKRECGEVDVDADADEGEGEGEGRVDPVMMSVCTQRN